MFCEITTCINIITRWSIPWMYMFDLPLLTFISPIYDYMKNHYLRWTLKSIRVWVCYWKVRISKMCLHLMLYICNCLHHVHLSIYTFISFAYKLHCWRSNIIIFYILWIKSEAEKTSGPAESLNPDTLLSELLESGWGVVCKQCLLLTSWFLMPTTAMHVPSELLLRSTGKTDYLTLDPYIAYLLWVHHCQLYSWGISFAGTCTAVVVMGNRPVN